MICLSCHYPAKYSFFFPHRANQNLAKLRKPFTRRVGILVTLIPLYFISGSCVRSVLLSFIFFFVILGNLIQVIESRKGKTFGGLSLKSADGRKEVVHQCFLFSGYLLLTTRSSSGRLHLSKVKIFY